MERVSKKVTVTDVTINTPFLNTEKGVFENATQNYTLSSKQIGRGTTVKAVEKILPKGTNFTIVKEATKTIEYSMDLATFMLKAEAKEISDIAPELPKE